jgi:hypothetical protein
VYAANRIHGGDNFAEFAMYKGGGRRRAASVVVVEEEVGCGRVFGRREAKIGSVDVVGEFPVRSNQFPVRQR